jgi:hypothetical protein
MSDAHEWLWVQAARLFSMAGEARENGDDKLADLLTEGASRCLNRLSEHEFIAERLAGPSERVH